MKILVTGAHFTPAVAVIEQLKSYPNTEIIYVGRKYTQEGDNTPSVESQVLPKLGVRFIPIITGRLQRSFTKYTVPSLFKIPIGFLQAFYIMLKEQPDVILSFGGYVAVPLIIVGWLFSIPIIIHEQTLVSGLANKISSFFADKIAVSFSENKSFDKRKTILTGNPIRTEILNPDKRVVLTEYQKIFTTAKNHKLPVIFITGGNQGSHIINQAVENCLNDLLKIACIIHQTGDSKFEDFERLSQIQNDRYLVKKWVDKEIGVVLLKADLVVSRAGINTLTETAYLGKPTLAIPIPDLYADEQTKNAHFFQNLGLVKIILQSKLNGDNLLEVTKNALSNLHELKREAIKAKKIIIADAPSRIALETILLA